MLTSLYPGMKSEDLAKRVAVLYMLTDKKNEIEQVEKRLHSILRGQDFEPVSQRIKHYLRNPPEDLLATKAPPPSDAWLNPRASKALSEAGLSAFDYLTVLMESDPSVRLLKTVDAATSERVEVDWLSLKENQEAETLDRLLQFYSQNGLDFVPPSPESILVIKKLKEQSQQIDETPLISEADAAALEEDPVVFAQKAARDASLNRIEQPVATTPEYPDLMRPDPLLDPKDVIDFPPTADNPFHNRVIVYNHRSVFDNYSDEAIFGSKSQSMDQSDEFTQKLPVSKRYFDKLHSAILMRRGVVQQTGKGKIRRISFQILVGNADGLVGLGEGKHANSMVALKSAQIEAVRNMDWVERFEKRTVWTEMRTKLGGTELILRPRPVGFGLRCNPYLHQILRAAGFKDISAKAGHAPTGMGDGLGGKGKKLSKGSGLVGQQELERARGRKLVSLRK
ncbi:hypothetical protein MD484_g6281, partial [Candolleomyces efflorescens]